MKLKMIAIALMVALLAPTAFGALTITSSEVTAWTLVAEGAHSATGANVIDISSNYSTSIQLQAFLNLDATAHEGTEFIFQVSQNSTGNEDWSDYLKFVDLVGTCFEQVSTANPLAAGATSITMADTEGLYETATTVNPHMGRWIGIEDTTLADSEVVWQTAFVADTSITCLDGTTTEHAQTTTTTSDIAMSRTFKIPMGLGSRIRVVINNSYDADGTACQLVYTINKTITTAL